MESSSTCSAVLSVAVHEGFFKSLDEAWTALVDYLDHRTPGTPGVKVGVVTVNSHREFIQQARLVVATGIERLAALEPSDDDASWFRRLDHDEGAIGEAQGLLQCLRSGAAV